MQWRALARPLRASNSSEVIVQLGVSERPVTVGRKDRLNHLSALSVSEVKTQRNSVPPLVVAADVVKIGKLGSAIGWAALEAERPRLIRAAAGIPKVSAVS